MKHVVMIGLLLSVLLISGCTNQSAEQNFNQGVVDTYTCMKDCQVEVLDYGIELISPDCRETCLEDNYDYDALRSLNSEQRSRVLIFRNVAEEDCQSKTIEEFYSCLDSVISAAKTDFDYIN